MKTYRVLRDIYLKDDSQARTWAYTDRKGREIGARVTTFIIAYSVDECSWGNHTTFAEAEDRARDLAKKPYGFKTHALRNGLAYGATGDDRYFATLEERDAAVAKYFKDAEKRAAKIK